MKLFIEIDLDNAAFEDDLDTELRRIFTAARNRVEAHHQLEETSPLEAKLPLEFKLLDSNGNTVGLLRLEEE